MPYVIRLAYSFVAVLLVSACAPSQLPRTAESVDLVIASTTDVHGRVTAWDYYANKSETIRGLTRAATIVDSVRAANPGRVILLDAGDLLQGNPLAYVAAKVSANRSNPIIAAMNAMHYDAAAIGNHEYNYGVPYLDSAVKQAAFPFLSANTYRVDPADVHAYRPWTIVDRAGIRIGVVGATTPGVMLWDAENIRGRLRLGDIVPAVRQAVQEVRAAGADIVLVTVHSGLNEPSSYDTVTTGVPSENVAARIASEIPGIDLVLYGHSHKEVRGATIGPTLLIQPKNWATSVDVAHLTVSRVGGAWRVTDKRSDLIQAAGHAEDPAVLAAAASIHRETVAYVTTPIGTTPDRWNADSARVKDTPLIDFILETERKAAGSDLASTAAFSTDVTMGLGPITIAQVAQLYPYDNTLRAVRITGRQLRDYLEFSSRYFRTLTSPTAPLETDPQVPGYNFDIVSGVDYALDISKPVGYRVTRLDYKGAPVRDTDTFTMALNNYRQTGGGGYAMLSGAPVVYDRQQEIRQLLIDEVKRRGALKQEDYFTPNWLLVRGPGLELNDRGAVAPPIRALPVVQPAFPAGVKFLRVIATNDFHGALEPRPDASGVNRGGAAYVATALDRARSECLPGCETILLDAGDLFQGTLASNLSYGRPVVEYYNRMGYAAAALGNHEFDWGVDTLRARMRQARFGIFGANVRDTAGRDVKWIPNDTIVTRGRIKIGIVGVSTVNTPTTTRAANVVGLRFDDPAPIIDSIGRVLRRRGANFIIVIAHAGATCSRDGAGACNGEIIDLARKLKTKVDAIVSGHTHTLVNTEINGIPIVQGRSSGRAIDVLDLPTGPDVGRSVRHEIRELAVDTIKPFPPVASIVRRAVARVGPIINRHVATIPQTLARQGPQYPLGNLIADAQRWAGKGDVAIMNNGGIRTELRAGEATYGSLFEIQPFGNTLYSLTMTGAQLRGLLETMLNKSPVNDHVSGLAIRYDPLRSEGARIVSATMADGTPLSDTREYNVIVNDFLATGGEGYNAGGRASASRALNITDLDALIDYLRTLPAPIKAPTEIRIAPVTP
ncbi:MAG: 2,3-cyclic-nucleotide 2-phosphodiesterase / 3-nucleotidase / 5-nucleotidase [Gemmatimonadaceae bacterium]|nr:2,3-cyclic-nucleotide 2-phosphodiesterase / 3-nucleotidase / 5-nucleotidase [Gemmatimonadaceae bacterium]